MKTSCLPPNTSRLVSLAACLLSIPCSAWSAPQAGDDDLSVQTRRVILTPKAVADDFGKRIAQSHLAVQVTVANNSKKLDLIIQHAALDLTKALPPERVVTFRERVREVNQRLRLRGPDRYNEEATAMTSSVDLVLLQGVAQKGQHFDIRNEAYRAILAIGTIGAGLVGAAGLGPVLPKAVAAWTGPGVTSFSTLFPDLTVDEIIRLNDRAYTANTLVPREKSKVFVVFMPLDLVLTPDEKKNYWKHPSDFISISTQPNTGKLDLSQLEVEIQYKHIIPVNEVPPMITDVVFDSKDVDNFMKKAPVHGTVVGRFLDGASVSLMEADALGLDIAVDTTRAAGDNRLPFVITPSKVVPGGTRLTFQVTRDKLVTPFPKLLTHHVPPATLTSIDPAKGSQKSDVVVNLVGSGFLEGDVTILIDGSTDTSGAGIRVSNLQVKDPTSLNATFSISDTSKLGDHDVQVLTSGGLSGVKKFTVEKAQ